MTKMLKKLAGDRSGATAIEYGLIAAFIALAMLVGLRTINTNLSAKFEGVGNALAEGPAAGGTGGQ